MGRKQQIACIRRADEGASQAKKLLSGREKDPPHENDPGRQDRDRRPIDAALDLVVFRKEILKSLEKVAGKGGVEKVF
jgi:hypothetical protein